MGGMIRLVVVFGKVAVTVLVIALVLYLSFLILNRVFRMFIDAMGYEAVDLLTWTKEKFPRLKKKGKRNVKKSKS